MSLTAFCFLPFAFCFYLRGFVRGVESSEVLLIEQGEK